MTDARRPPRTAVRWAAALMLALPPLIDAATYANAQDTAAPQRVITLAPHITELLFAAGAGDRIVATVNSSDYPPIARTLPKVGDGLNVDAEKILAYQPDLVIAWHNTAALDVMRPILDRLNVPLLYSKPQSLDDIPAQLRRFGELFHTSGPAEQAARALEKRLEALRRTHGRQAVKRVFIEVGSTPIYTMGSDPLLNDVLKTCDGVNLYAGAAVAAPLVGTEDVLARNPDILIVPAAEKQQVQAARQRWAALGLPAAQAGRVFGIHPDFLFRPGPRLIDATEELCGKMDYPVKLGSIQSSNGFRTLPTASYFNAAK